MQIKQSLIGILGRVLSFFASHIPTKNQVCFSSTPDFSDNSYALYKCFLSNKLDELYSIVWLVYDRNRLSEIRNRITENGSHNTIAIYKYSFRGVWSYIRSRYVFETHGLYPFLRLDQHPDKHICLWHGMPLKKLGASIGTACSPNCDYTIASSELFQQIMSKAFNKPVEKIIITGLPRCDLLFEKSDFLDSIGFDKTHYRSVGVWLPTYRQSIFGEIRSDGEFTEGKISILSVDELKDLDEFLEGSSDFLFIKIHLMDALQLYDFPKFKNICIIKPSDFRFQLYPFIGACDYLLTDYSSVFVDFAITGKPMGFVIDDLLSYKNTRGLYFSNLDQILPGSIINDYKSLTSFIRNPLSKRSSLQLNAFNDDCSSERILHFLGLLPME